MTDLLADAQAQLYAADPDDFTQRRAELAAAARDAGEPATAKKIAGLRKPTRSAWVVNRLVRADPQVTSRLAALSAGLRGAKPTDGGTLRELTAARGRLVDELTRQALATSGLAAPPAALREKVTATLDAAIADPQVAANLGTLVRAARWAGFGVDPGTPFPASPSAPSPRRPQAPDPAEVAAEQQRRRHEKIISAERAWAEATASVQAAAAAEQDLEDTVRRLETELAEARQQLAEARRQGYRAESRQRRAGAELSRLRE